MQQCVSVHHAVAENALRNRDLVSVHVNAPRSLQESVSCDSLLLPVFCFGPSPSSFNCFSILSQRRSDCDPPILNSASGSLRPNSRHLPLLLQFYPILTERLRLFIQHALLFTLLCLSYPMPRTSACPFLLIRLLSLTLNTLKCHGWSVTYRNTNQVTLVILSSPFSICFLIF